MQKLLILLIAAAALAAGGCSIHRPAVQQGNVLDPEAVAQLKPGLSKRQVRFILGDPLVADPFHPQRWDYVYRLKERAKEPVRQRVTIYFDGDVVSRMDMEGVAPPAAAPAPR